VAKPSPSDLAWTAAVATLLGLALGIIAVIVWEAWR